MNNLFVYIFIPASILVLLFGLYQILKSNGLKDDDIETSVNIDEFLFKYKSHIDKKLLEKIESSKLNGGTSYKINSEVYNRIIFKSITTPKTTINPSHKHSVLNSDYKPTSKQDTINRVNYLKVEQRELQSTLDRHVQIIQESLRIMQSTNNVETLKSRYDEIWSNHTMIGYYIEQGYDVNIDKDFTTKLSILYNDRICAIASLKVNEYALKMQSLKTEKAKDNNTKKIFLLLDQYNKKINKNHNHIESMNKISELKNKVEDIYS